MLADLEHLGELVADEEHGDALGLQPADDLEERPHLAFGQRRGRLVHDDEPRVRGQRPADRDKLLVGDRERLDPHAERDVDTDPRQHARGQRLHPAAIDKPPPGVELGGEADVLGDGQVREEREVLEDHHDPRRGRLPRRQPPKCWPATVMRARVGFLGSREDLDERRLAAAVLPGQADGLPCTDREPTSSSARMPA